MSPWELLTPGPNRAAPAPEYKTGISAFRIQIIAHTSKEGVDNRPEGRAHHKAVSPLETKIVWLGCAGPPRLLDRTEEFRVMPSRVYNVREPRVAESIALDYAPAAVTSAK